MAENDVKVTLAKIEEEIAAKLSSLSSSYISKNKLVTQEVYTKKANGEIEDFLAFRTTPTLVQLPGLERDLPHRAGVKEKDNFIKVINPTGAYAYGINSSAAELLLDVFNPIKCPIDYYRYLIRHYGLEVFAYSEKMVSVDMESESTIGLERFKTYKGIRWICFKVWRIIGKTLDGVLMMFEK